jgi:WD40 repeat protein
MRDLSGRPSVGVLAAPTRRYRRLTLVSVAAAGLALALIAAGVTIAVDQGPSLIATLTGPPGSHGASSAAFSPDGKVLAILDRDGSTQVWDVATRSLTATLTSPQCRGADVEVAFSPDGSMLAVIGSADGTTCLWDLSTRRQIATVTAPSNSNVSVVGGAFSPDGKTLAIADSSGSTYLWNVSTGKVVATLNDPVGGGATPALAGIAFSPDGRLATADSDGGTYLWNVTAGRVTATLNDPNNGPYLDSGGPESAAFGADRTLAVGDGDGQVYLWDAATGSVTATLTPPINVVEANMYYYSPYADVAGQVEGGGGAIPVTVAFSRDGNVLAAGVYYGYGVCVWNSSGNQIASVTDPGGDNSGAPQLALSPDGSLLAIVDANGRTYLWRVG